MIEVTFPISTPKAPDYIGEIVDKGGAIYRLHYRYEQRGPQWWAVLTTVTEVLPAMTPEVLGFGDEDKARLPMMREGMLDREAEAAQRCKEWAAINDAENTVKPNV